MAWDGPAALSFGREAALVVPRDVCIFQRAGGSNFTHHLRAERMVSARHGVRTMLGVQLSKFCMSQSEQ